MMKLFRKLRSEMNKYRIIKVVTKNDSGEEVKSAIYYIQRGCFNLWHTERIKTLNNSIIGLQIETEEAYFFKEEDAKKCLEEIKNPFSLVYKGEKIIKVWVRDRESGYVFINLSSRRYHKICGYYYDYCYSTLSRVKSSIDKSRINTTVTTIE